MASPSSNRVCRQVHRLFNVGVIGATSDAQLLEWFATRRDDAREAVFEELMFRHGPMVFRVCRSVLLDTSDAEDAFQAVFLILACRANSIRRRGSVASWLFGVVHRVALRAKGDAARRRARELRVAIEANASYAPADERSDEAILHDEINRLPEGLRAAVTLCYLEGLSYDAAAQQLGVSEGTIRGRLVRARECLRRRLTARGMTVPAGLMVTGMADLAQAAIPVELASSTVRIALGFMTGNTVGLLARRVMNSMLLNQLKVAAVILITGVGVHYWAWNAAAGIIHQQGQAEPAPIAGKAPKAVPAPESSLIAPAKLYRLTGSVRVEGTGEPIAGAKLNVRTMSDFFNSETNIERPAVSGADGLFAIDLPPGAFSIRLVEPPIGYYSPTGNARSSQSLMIGPDEPLIRRNFQVRKGTVWDIQFTRGPDRNPCTGFVSGGTRGMLDEFESQVDDTGCSHVTLPSQVSNVRLSVREASPKSSTLDLGGLFLGLSSDLEFRPDEVELITPANRTLTRTFNLIDTNNKSASLTAGSPAIEPVIENGRLVIRVSLPDRGPQDFGAVTGLVLDDNNQPIAGARLGLAANFDFVSTELRHQSTTNAEGQYRLRDIPRWGIDGQPLKFQIVAVKEGFAGLASPPLSLEAGNTEKFQVLDPIELKPGASVTGVVIDHRGHPVAGANVHSNKPVRYRGLSARSQNARTDENGRFAMHDLQRGMTTLSPSDGFVFGGSSYVRVGTSEPVVLQLSEPRPRREPPLKGLTARSDPLRVGQPAVEWQVGAWSDGRQHLLANDRGKATVLYFWGTDFRQSVEALPALAGLAARFAPRGVVFLAIHRPDGDEKPTIDEARRLLSLTKAPITFALDRTRLEGHSRGMTAQQYGVIHYPTLIVIDGNRKIAFRSDMTAGDRNLAGVFLKILTDPQEMTKDQANQLVEQAIANEIESALKPNY